MTAFESLIALRVTDMLFTECAFVANITALMPAKKKFFADFQTLADFIRSRTDDLLLVTARKLFAANDLLALNFHRSSTFLKLCASQSDFMAAR